ncbi:MAG: hypothetical protein K0Q87_586 [Neobacillus sp.]|nr:hypothetical protein [Neobacillus sp.]
MEYRSVWYNFAEGKEKNDKKVILNNLGDAHRNGFGDVDA